MILESGVLFGLLFKRTGFKETEALLTNYRYNQQQAFLDFGKSVGIRLYILVVAIDLNLLKAI
jgi:hypothetical protein